MSCILYLVFTEFGSENGHEKNMKIYYAFAKVPIESDLLVEDGKSKRWFVYVNNVLEQYGLPSTMELFDAGCAKAQWKSLYEQAVNGYWSLSGQTKFWKRLWEKLP